MTEPLVKCPECGFTTVIGYECGFCEMLVEYTRFRARRSWAMRREAMVQR